MDGLPVQPDFYYARTGIPGVCIFVDGPHHDDPGQQKRDAELREALRDEGYRVIVLSWHRDIAEQVDEWRDILEGA